MGKVAVTQEGLRDMATAPRDRYILAVFRGHPDNERTRHYDGRSFVIRHEGMTMGGYDMGWALFPGYGGVPDTCFYGWLPLPEPAIRLQQGSEKP